MSTDAESPLIEALSLEPWLEEEPTRRLAPLDYRIGATGMVCLIGNRSAVLTAYLRVLGGVDSPRHGKLNLFGTPLQRFDREAWRRLRRKIGFVTRRAPLLSVLSGMENVLLPALYHKCFERGEAQRRAGALISQLNCRADLKALPAFLSPLERIQLAIARAAILEPPVMFLEEPFHELALSEQEAITGFLQQWRLQHSLLVTTHNLNFVRRNADRIIFAGNGGIHYFDSWHALRESDAKEPGAYLRRYQQLHQL